MDSLDIIQMKKSIEELRREHAITLKIAIENKTFIESVRETIKSFFALILTHYKNSN